MLRQSFLGKGISMRNFYEMERKYGTAAAYHCLLEIEKAARISSSDMNGVDLETRFQNACRLQDAMIVQDAAPVEMGQVT